MTACGYWSSFVEYIAVKNAKNVEGEMNRYSECQNREKRMVWFEICSLRNGNPLEGERRLQI